jgi:tRNA threonylcarbamoyladenosine biosynthesis protein TsaB
MRTLAIETAGRTCSIALLENSIIVAERHEQVGRGHAERLIPWIAALPDGGRADQIIVGCGPGSFTGARIGIAAARGLALGWGIPVYGISSLLLVAADCSADHVVVAVEGGHGELLVQEFAREGLRALTEFMSARPELAVAAMRAHHVAGDGAQRLIAARGYGTAIDADARASNIRHLPPDLAMLPPTPLYGRAPDAQPNVVVQQ